MIECKERQVFSIVSTHVLDMLNHQRNHLLLYQNATLSNAFFFFVVVDFSLLQYGLSICSSLALFEQIAVAFQFAFSTKCCSIGLDL